MEAERVHGSRTRTTSRAQPCNPKTRKPQNELLNPKPSTLPGPQLTGGGDTLGNWTAENGLRLDWSEGDNWVATVPMPAGTYEFKAS